MSLTRLLAANTRLTYRKGWRRCADHTKELCSSPLGTRSFSSNASIRSANPIKTNDKDHASSAEATANKLSGIQRAHSRCCVITGATSGIGYAITKGLMQEGATHIRLLARNAEKANAALEQLKQDTNQSRVHTEIVHFDAQSDRPDEALFRKRDGWPDVDTLILSAGIAQSTLATRTPSSEAILKVNLEANIQLSSTFLQHYESFIKHNRRNSESSNNPDSFCLVSISSLLAIKGGYGASTYAASKAGLMAYNRALCLEAGAFHKRVQGRVDYLIPPFRVNTVLPGYINTPMISGMTGSSGKLSVENQIPLGRLGEADEVADAVLFLLANRYANNTVLNLDGGLSAT